MQPTLVKPKATYIHCAAHRLNLCIDKCCSMQEISNMMDVADNVVKFFKYSPKHQQYFEECIDAEFNTTIVVPKKNAKSLKNYVGQDGLNDMMHLLYF